MYRVNAVTSKNLKEAQFEAKYNVDVVRTEQGEVKVKKRSEEEMLEFAGKGGQEKAQGRQGVNRSHDSFKGHQEAKGALRQEEARKEAEDSR